MVFATSMEVLSCCTLHPEPHKTMVPWLEGMDTPTKSGRQAEARMGLHLVHLTSNLAAKRPWRDIWQQLIGRKTMSLWLQILLRLHRHLLAGAVGSASLADAVGLRVILTSRKPEFVPVCVSVR